MREESLNSIISSIKQWQSSMSQQNMHTFVLLSSTAISFAVYLLVFFCIAQQDNVALAQFTGNRETCKAEGEAIDTQAIPYMKCYDCNCKNGFIECVKRKCPSIDGCHLVQDQKKGDCCRKCKGCTKNGVYHESGTEWTDESDPCRKFECIAGVITESKIQCYTPCKATIPPLPGQCCPTCADCHVNGQKIGKNKTYITPDEDPCVSCECDSEKLSCSRKTCPVLNCPESKIVQGFKECCPQCLGTASYLDPPGGACIISATTVYKSGTEFTLDNCTICTCENSTIHCQKRSCPVLLCKQQELPAGECCAKCKSVATDTEVKIEDEDEHEDVPGIEFEEQSEDEQTDEEPAEDPIEVHKVKPKTCTVAGKTYKNGETWNAANCNTCSCTQGEVTCVPVMCPALKCPSKKILKVHEGQCCPVCTEDQEVCTVFGGSHFRSFDGKLFAFVGSCKYQLATDCDSGTFNVRLKNTVVGNDASIKRISLRVGNAKVDLQSNGHTKVNEVIVDLPYRSRDIEVKEVNDDIFVTSGMGISVRWNYLGFCELKVPRIYRKRVCGLCGNFNSDPEDDLITREGIAVDEPAVFAQSWVTEDDDCLDTRKYGIRGCDPSKHQRLCNYVRGSVFSKCLKRINVTSYYETCLKDMCDCPPEDLHCHCESFATYVRDCRRLGILLPRWRKSVGC